MKLTFRTTAIAACAFASVALLSPKADAARPRVYIYGGHPYYTFTGLAWDAVRTYYAGGPWSGVAALPYSWAGWSAYAGQNGIGCTPGTAVKGGDGILYRCQ